MALELTSSRAGPSISTSAGSPTSASTTDHPAPPSAQASQLAASSVPNARFFRLQTIHCCSSGRHLARNKPSSASTPPYKKLRSSRLCLSHDLASFRLSFSQPIYRMSIRISCHLLGLLPLGTPEAALGEHLEPLLVNVRPRPRGQLVLHQRESARVEQTRGEADAL